MALQKALPGNTMPFPGIPDQEERNDLIAYLETLE
jgi:cytochrome c2